MEYGHLYASYLENLMEITEQLTKEESSRGAIAKDERSAVSDIENNFMRQTDELRRAKEAVRSQYHSVWESCTQSVGLRRPRDQRPLETALNWREAVHLQEVAASKIREWFSIKSQQAVVERQRKLQEEAKRKAAVAAAEAMEAKKKAEEAARAEQERGNAFVEELKRKFRK